MSLIDSMTNGFQYERNGYPLGKEVSNIGRDFQFDLSHSLTSPVFYS